MAPGTKNMNIAKNKYIVGHSTSSRNQLAHPAFEKSCQNEIMRSNNFDLKVIASWCSEPETRAKNCKN